MQKPVVHGEWLKALVGGGGNKPLKPTPELTAFRPVVLTVQGPLLVKADPRRRWVSIPTRRFSCVFFVYRGFVLCDSMGRIIDVLQSGGYI